MARYMMTARRRAALRKAQLASARKRRRHGRINKKIKKTTAKTNRKIAKARNTFSANLYTTNQGGIYTTTKGVKAYNKAYKTRIRGERKVAKLKAKKRRR